MLLFPRITLSVYLPIFATQTCHDAHFAQLVVEGGIQGMHVHVVDEAVEVFLVLLQVRTFPCEAVSETLLRGVLVRQSCIRPCLQF